MCIGCMAGGRGLLLSFLIAVCWILRVVVVVTLRDGEDPCEAKGAKGEGSLFHFPSAADALLLALLLRTSLLHLARRLCVPAPADSKNNLGSQEAEAQEQLRRSSPPSPNSSTALVTFP